MSLDFKVVSAIFRKDMRMYLGNPTGYVFLTLFIAATAAAAFLTEEFFARNLADLATLNRWMPAVLMFFVPAITMNAWADERRGGTDELLLTLPVRDSEVVLGKYLGVLGMFTLSLGLSTAHVVVLAMLGDPDPGLMFSTYAGYWLMGALFAAVGLLGSMFTMNTTVAFILGGLGCAGLVFTGALPWASAFLGVAIVGLLVALSWVVSRGSARGSASAGLAGAILAGIVWRSLEPEGDAKNPFEEAFGALSIEEHFRSFGEGVIRLADRRLLRRRCRGAALPLRVLARKEALVAMALSLRHHRLIRLLALAGIFTGLTYAAHRGGQRTDVTSEGLSRLTPGTLELIESIGTDRPVTVHAFVSEDVPRDYVTVRSRVLNILREMEARGGPGLRVRIVEPKEFSPEAEEAMDRYGIYPAELAEREGGQLDVKPVFMGLAFVSGANEEVVPFLSRGLSAEYEVARALRVVTQDKKKVVGILRTDATIMGNFDIQSRSQQPAWKIVDELKKQYEVRSLNPGAAIPEDVDVLFVPQLASLTQGELDQVRSYIDAGRPALLTADPFPTFNIRLAPREEKPSPQGQGGMFGRRPTAVRAQGRLRRPAARHGRRVAGRRGRLRHVQPAPELRARAAAGRVRRQARRRVQPFENADTVVNGLEEVVVLFAGELRQASGSTTTFTPLLQTGRSAGYALYEDMIDRHPLFRAQPILPPAKQSPVTGKNMVLAARLTGGGGGLHPPRSSRATSW